MPYVWRCQISYNGSGTFNINTAGQPVVTGTVISSTAFNALTSDLGTGLSTAITKDGQTVATARIPFAQGINSSLVTDATNTTTGSIITAGGVGIAKALYVGTTLNVAGASTLAAITGTTLSATGNITTTAGNVNINAGGILRFYDATGAEQGRIQGTSTPRLSINTISLLDIGGNTAITGTLSATTTGKVGTTLGVGAATPSASGAGITFPATQSASTDANTLDDYEEGTWTPSIGGTATYNAQEGTYTKIGRVVTVSGRLHILLKLTGSNTVVSGLPFTSAATYRYGIAIGQFSAIANSAFTVYGALPQSSTTFELFCTTAAGTSNYVAGVFTDSTNIVFTFTYSV